MLRRLVKSLTNGHSHTGVTKDTLFDPIPADCDLKCHSCTIKYPASFKIEEDADLWQTSDGWATHILIATGKSDWVRNVDHEKGSIMEALSKAKKPTNGKLMVSASNMCPPPEYFTETPQPTTCIILPSWMQVENVTPNDVNELIDKFISPAPTTTTPMVSVAADDPPDEAVEIISKGANEIAPAPASPSTTATAPQKNSVGENGLVARKTDTRDSQGTNDDLSLTSAMSNLSVASRVTQNAAELAASSYLKSNECPHDYLILLCSHKHRDARCGQSAPLLLKELRRQLQPLGLYRDLDDYRPGGVGIYFINHVGGHKWSANMIIYRKKAGQGIWLARVKPNDIEAIVRWTVLDGKVQPEKIRAGFDRCKGLTSW
ncbi:hypothetical protein H072_7847 [Dactylellina haptotyla CBS 200.50]|uniref:Actin patches distal protein 1 n=1 Tax=Dactylellina haptotyla (strain CBS 200.50) TaxID=1284197 RepID=S8A5Y1_DACHA|nr:hypothetical protein H072_7847 [Dactylellina haptotyla CBS 200.50]